MQQLRILDKKVDTLLPTIAKAIIWRPSRLKYLLIGPPKWGKTTFFSGCPNVCLLAFEAGYSEVDCPKIVITCWDRSYKERKLGWDEDEDGVVYTSAMEVIEELENYCPYDMVIIDTLDVATKMASDYHCRLARVEHPSEGGDYGRGWDLLQTKPVRIFYNRLVKLGIGVAAITHSTEKKDPDKFGKVKPKRETSLPGKVQHFAHTQADVIMHAFRARRRKGQKERDRCITFDGTDELMAGTRIRKVYIPNKYIVTPPSRDDDSPPWKQWESFFTNNPESGKLAEEQFVKLFRGSDDEYLTEEEDTTTKQEQDNVKEKATSRISKFKTRDRK
jgi:hypothetical protein